MTIQIERTRAFLEEQGLLPDPSPNSLGWFFDTSSGDYLAEIESIFIRQKETDLKRRLRAEGHLVARSSGSSNSLFDDLLLKTQNQNGVDFAGPVAGLARGLQKNNGNRILVTQGPKLIAPVAGDWSMLHSILDNLLGEEQLRYFLYWLHLYLEALYGKRSRPGQVVFLCGPANSGKSLVQSILTLLTGGTTGNPYQFAMGRTDFNADLCAAGHLMIEDEAPAPDKRCETHWSNYIKQIAASPFTRLHRKHKTPLELTLHQRMTVSINDEPENLRLIPHLNESLRDKLMIFKVRHHEMPMATRTSEEKERFISAIRSELPGFINDVLNCCIPREYSDTRFGVRHFHNSEILQELKQTSDQMRFLRNIDHSLSNDGYWKREILDSHTDQSAPGALCISASDLEGLLTQDCRPHALEARRLLNNEQQCSRLLGLLASDMPFVIQRGARRNDIRRWILFPPRNRDQNPG